MCQPPTPSNYFSSDFGHFLLNVVTKNAKMSKSMFSVQDIPRASNYGGVPPPLAAFVAHVQKSVRGVQFLPSIGEANGLPNQRPNIRLYRAINLAL